MCLIEDEINEEITGKQRILNKWQKYVKELYETRNRPAILDIENEIHLSEYEKEFPIMMEEIEVAIKKTKNGKTRGVGGIPIELVKCLGEGKKGILSLCNKIYNEGEWPEKFKVVFLPIQKKNNA